MKVVRIQMALEDIKTLAQILEKSIRFGSSFNHQMAPCNSIFLDPLHNFKNQNCKMYIFLASNNQNLMASDENNWFFDVVYSKRVKNKKFVKSLNSY